MDETSQSARKHQAILDAARSVFLRKGYGGASMDEVAAQAAVSKQTVYKHFADKRRLFEAIITNDISATESLTHDMVASLSATDDLEHDLRQFARGHIDEVTQPHLIQLRRIIIAEADRFPDLAKSWFANGPERAHATLAAQFQELERRGLLTVPDPVLAAQHFNWLVLSIPLNKAMFHPDHKTPRRELNHYADEAVRIFLAAYAAEPNT
ncbi:TetR/AcrR family transcriptional regulator [Actinophytocola sp. NPDC049390]|uniref:TetR/AcrR family transcriptional regulator n=1 Tax=Actinophytocola sp. NPDC049390 TaxID=3363894 RepID=UPI0037A079FC